MMAKSAREATAPDASGYQLRTMLDLKTSVTEAANHLTQRVSRAATDALGALTDSLSRAGMNAVDGVLAKASKLVGMPEEEHAAEASAPPVVHAAPHGKAAAKKRKQARLSMQRLVKAAKRTASSARHRMN